MMYKIILPIFEGPLDLLLYFIKRDEINIYDIPIARITDEFLNYLKMMKELDIEVASEFVVMASTLMEIKAKMLLPIEKKDELTQSEDPRKELVQQLLDYQVFKEASQSLENNLEFMQNIYYRGIYESDISELSAKFKTYKPASVYDLAKAFYEIIKRKEEEGFQIIKIAEYKIEDAISNILEILTKEQQISFQKLCLNEKKQIVVLYFVAILELVKQGKIYAYQSDLNGDIFLFSVSKFYKN
ncbi:MAG: segregation/condensation protein A [Ignavibacteria bacterium]|nr:segregation/condensation protein A [Ignavibacteria bacterium]